MKWFEDGFYSDESAPEGSVDVTDSQWHKLLAGQAAGKMIVSGTGGVPKLQDRPVVSLNSEQAYSARIEAYRSESDPLKNEAEYDAQISGEAPDYSLWIRKVQEIKARYPIAEESK